MDPSTLVRAASLSTSGLTSGSPPTASTAPIALSDAELLTATRRLVGRSNQLLASLLAHLGEVEARGIHRTRACASLYAYCIYVASLLGRRVFALFGPSRRVASVGR